MKFVKKPVVVEAEQWINDNSQEIFAWMQAKGYNLRNGATVFRNDITQFLTLRFFCERSNGPVTIYLGGWVIEEPNKPGAFYPCTNEDFQKTYDSITDEIDLVPADPAGILLDHSISYPEPHEQAMRDEAKANIDSDPITPGIDYTSEHGSDGKDVEYTVERDQRGNETYRANTTRP
jgi:hypothetical protein